MILADTSVWIDHLNRGPDDQLVVLLDGGSVVMHDFVLGEIAMGSIKNRVRELRALGDLHRLPTARNVEVRLLIETAGLHGSGLSFIDAHLLTAARAAPEHEPVRIWTRDKRLHAQAERLGVAFAP